MDALNIWCVSIDNATLPSMIKVLAGMKEGHGMPTPPAGRYLRTQVSNPSHALLYAYADVHDSDRQTDRQTQENTQTHRQIKVTHQHAQVHLFSYLSILFLMLLVSMSPNSCSGARANAHS